MPRQCQITGKKPVRGHTYAIRGIAKKKKGIGLKITGKTKRWFRPNLHKKKVWFPEENRYITLQLSSHGLRTLEKIGVKKVVENLRKEGTRV